MKKPINKKLIFAFVLFMLTGAVFTAILPSRLLAATYTVTKTGDTNDGTCDADCSLREAVAAANASAGADTINFNIPSSDSGFVPASGSTQAYFVLPLSSVLTLSDSAGTTINGYSQSGSSRNTAPFGSTINAVLNIQISANANLSFVGGNNHITGINLTNGAIITSLGSNTNWIEGNFFGTDITGMTPASGATTIMISNGSTSDIIGTNGDGSDDVGERNLLVFNNAVSGAINTNSVSGANNIIVAGNYFGTDKTGRACSSIGTNMGRNQIIIGGDNVRIGTNYDGVSDSEESNIIACAGIPPSGLRAELRLAGNNELIQGNYIGTDPQGDNLASSLAETGIRDSVGPGTGWIIKGNTIAFNGGPAMGLTQSVGMTISQNSIYSNGGLGIDLGEDGVTPNDAGDVDSGAPNTLMNYPVITKAGILGNSLIIKADLDFKASEAPYTIEFFDNDTLDPSGYGQGKYYIGSVTTSLTGSGVVLMVPITGHVPTAISKITATATNAQGSTSEFSAASADPVTYTSAFSSGGVVINGGEAVTNTQYVTLALNASSQFNPPSSMEVSNDPNFGGASYEAYASAKTWTLDAGASSKTVFARFKDALGNVSDTYTGMIVFVPRRGGSNPSVFSASSGSPAPVEPSASPLTEEKSADPAIQNPSPTPAASVPEVTGDQAQVPFEKNLKKGMTDPDVERLQVFLNTHGFLVSTAGPGSVGNETMYFGSATQSAVIKFQIAHGITPSVGYVGPLTRAVLNGK